MRQSTAAPVTDADLEIRPRPPMIGSAVAAATVVQETPTRIRKPLDGKTAWAQRRKGRLAFMHLFAASQIKPIERRPWWRLPWAYRMLAWATGLVIAGIAAWAVVMRAFSASLRWSIG